MSTDKIAVILIEVRTIVRRHKCKACRTRKNVVKAFVKGTSDQSENQSENKTRSLKINCRKVVLTIRVASKLN